MPRPSEANEPLLENPRYRKIKDLNSGGLPCAPVGVAAALAAQAGPGWGPHRSNSCWWVSCAAAIGLPPITAVFQGQDLCSKAG